MACVSTLYTTRQFIGVLSAARLRRVYDQRGACFDRPPDSSSAAADFCAINRRISRPTNAASRLPVSALNSAAVFHWLIAYKSLLSGPGRLPVYKSIRPGRAGEYCDKGVCLFICLSARPFQEPHIRITEFSTVCMLPAAVARPWSYRKFSALLWCRCDTLCIGLYTGFTDDVMFADSRPAELKATHKRSSQTDSPGATPDRKQSLTPDDCLVKDRFFPFSSTCLEYDNIRSVVEKSAFVPGWQQKWKRKNSDMFVA